MVFPDPSGLTAEESIRDGTLSCNDADSKELGTGRSGPATLRKTDINHIASVLNNKKTFTKKYINSEI